MAVVFAFPLASRFGQANWRWTCAGMAIAVIAGVQFLLPAYTNRHSMKEPASALAKTIDAGTPVICYPRPCNGAAFYWQPDHLKCFSEVQRDEMIHELQLQPKAILFVRSGRTLEELLSRLPRELCFEELDHRGGTTIGLITAAP